MKRKRIVVITAVVAASLAFFLAVVGVTLTLVNSGDASKQHGASPPTASQPVSPTPQRPTSPPAKASSSPSTSSIPSQAEASSAATTSLLTPDFSAIKGGELVTMFNRFSLPYPDKWQQDMSADFVMNFADTTNCTGDMASCPHVVFIDTSSQDAENTFGPDPVKSWANEGCASGDKSRLDKPAGVMLNMRPSKLYAQHCGKAVRYAWEVPDEHLVVLQTVASKGTPQIVEAMLENARWGVTNP